MINKKLFIGTAAFLVFIFIISSAYLLISSPTTKKETPFYEGPTPGVGTKTNKPTNQPTTVPEELKKEINTVVGDEIETEIPKDIISTGNIRRSGDYIIVTIYSKDDFTDPANAVLKKENNKWRVIYGPGTDLTPEELRPIGVPEDLIKQANSI